MEDTRKGGRANVCCVHKVCPNILNVYTQWLWDRIIIILWSIVLRYFNGTLVTVNDCTLPILKMADWKFLLWKISSHTQFISDTVHWWYQFLLSTYWLLIIIMTCVNMPKRSIINGNGQSLPNFSSLFLLHCVWWNNFSHDVDQAEKQWILSHIY